MQLFRISTIWRLPSCLANFYKNAQCSSLSNLLENKHLQLNRNTIATSSKINYFECSKSIFSKSSQEEAGNLSLFQCSQILPGNLRLHCTSPLFLCLVHLLVPSDPHEPHHFLSAKRGSHLVYRSAARVFFNKSLDYIQICLSIFVSIIWRGKVKQQQWCSTKYEPSGLCFLGPSSSFKDIIKLRIETRMWLCIYTHTPSSIWCSGLFGSLIQMSWKIMQQYTKLLRSWHPLFVAASSS